MTYSIISNDPVIQAHYIACRKEGTSHALAEMFAFGQPPQSRTDKEFLAGHVNGSQFESKPQDGDFYASVAKKHGVNPKGKVYLSQLANYPGDPRAWVAGRGDLQKVCDDRGWGSEGLVDVKKRSQDEPLPSTEIALAPDIVERHVEAIVEANPDAGRDKEALREKVFQEHKPHWSK